MDIWHLAVVLGVFIGLVKLYICLQMREWENTEYWRDASSDESSAHQPAGGK